MYVAVKETPAVTEVVDKRFRWRDWKHHLPRGLFCDAFRTIDSSCLGYGIPVLLEDVRVGLYVALPAAEWILQ